MRVTRNVNNLNSNADEMQTYLNSYYTGRS